uniref:Putative secreted protein n=1 Tax=Anopheles triannulatus TaxID=58253 RepID=A0A2M4B5P7_9DIPT
MAACGTHCVCVLYVLASIDHLAGALESEQGERARQQVEGVSKSNAHTRTRSAVSQSLRVWMCVLLAIFANPFCMCTEESGNTEHTVGAAEPKISK